MKDIYVLAWLAFLTGAVLTQAFQIETGIHELREKIDAVEQNSETIDRYILDKMDSPLSTTFEEINKAIDNMNETLRKSNENLENLNRELENDVLDNIGK